MTGRFLHGVASGDPTASSVVLWTRVTVDEPDASVDWEIATDEAFEHLVASGTAVASEERDHTVHVDVSGLAAGAPHRFRFSSGGEVSPIGRTRTLPAATAASIRLATVSCAKFNAGYFNAYKQLAGRDDLDLVVHLGDYIYEASNTPPKSQTPGADIGRPFDPLHECKTLQDYRTR